MITFTLIAGFLLALCYILFKQETFGRKRLTSIMIIGIGTLVLYTVASGLISKKYPLKRVIYATHVLNGVSSPFEDTRINASIGFNRETRDIYIESDEYFSSDEITIKFLSVHDTIPRVIVTQYERDIDSYLWIADWGIPYMNRMYTAYIPNDKNNIAIVSFIFSTLNQTEDEETI